MRAAATRHDHAAEIRRSVTDPIRIAKCFGLTKGATPQTDGGISVRCPAHADGHASCSIRRGNDGTVSVKCFGCPLAGDLFVLAAAVYGLDYRRDFVDVMRATAERFGLHQIAEELSQGRQPIEPRPLPPAPEPGPAREYPPRAEVSALWDASVPVSDLEVAQVALGLRGLFPDRDQARAVVSTNLPRWASYRGRSWFEAGYRVVLPVYDHEGAMRSLRAWNVDRDSESPKRLPPSGFRATGLVLASTTARQALAAPAGPVALLATEGEPDYLAACQSYPGVAVIGVGSGSWSDDFAARIPLGSEVAIHTHHDEAGERYAAQIIKSLAKRAIIRRSKP